MAVIIVQARLTSTRFPNKILEYVGGQPGLFHVIDQCLKSDAKKVVLAIPDSQTEKFKVIMREYNNTSNKQLIVLTNSV